MCHPHLIVLSALFVLWGATACSSTKVEPKGPSAKAHQQGNRPVDDHALCEWKDKADREVSEVAGPGSITPNVRRVYQLVGSSEDRHKVLICREIDTNFDGRKDVVRRYSDKGESVSEETDSNFDGKLDTWITFIKGRLAETKLDTNFDGKEDEWKYYVNGKLVRVVRDTNYDTKPDIWEIYRDGHLERMGVDVDGDEHVDRWDHDNEMRRRFEDAERKKEDAERAAAEKKAQADHEAADNANDAIEDAPGASKRKPKKM